MEHPKTVLVTGGAGYVGSHIILDLLHNEYDVISIDNLVNSYAESELAKPEVLKRVEKLTGKIVFSYNIDIRKQDELEQVFKSHKIDCVIHCAALKAVGESVKVPLKYYQNNITGTNILLQVMKNNNVTKLVFSSSATVYGTPQFLPITEAHPTGQGCTNPYGRTKYFIEEILKDVCAADSSWGVISLRYFNPVGADESGQIGEDPAGTPNNLMPFIAQVAVGRQPLVQIFGNDYDTVDGTGVRDYIHISDLANGHVCSLNRLLNPAFVGFQVFNLGTGRGYSVLEVIDAFKRASKKDIPVHIVERRDGDVASSYADAKLAKLELGWTAHKGIDDMCKDAWNWQSNNPNGFKS